MNSSTSGSEAAAWRGFVATFFGTPAVLTVGPLAALALLDPYDRGAFEPRRGTPESAPRIAGASRARDPAFDAAVLGNPHIQLVDPAALSRATGFRFVSLAVPGTGPREQLAILDAVLRHHGEGTRALVRPPVHASALPPPASSAARAEATCLRAIESLTAGHAGTTGSGSTTATMPSRWPVGWRRPSQRRWGGSAGCRTLERVGRSDSQLQFTTFSASYLRTASEKAAVDRRNDA